jgi:hypothetical protein
MSSMTRKSNIDYRFPIIEKPLASLLAMNYELSTLRSLLLALRHQTDEIDEIDDISQRPQSSRGRMSKERNIKCYNFYDKMS